jgi:hypothetical protein
MVKKTCFHSNFDNRLCSIPTARINDTLFGLLPTPNLKKNNDQLYHIVSKYQRWLIS